MRHRQPVIRYRLPRRVYVNGHTTGQHMMAAIVWGFLLSWITPWTIVAVPVVIWAYLTVVTFPPIDWKAWGIGLPLLAACLIPGLRPLLFGIVVIWAGIAATKLIVRKAHDPQHEWIVPAGLAVMATIGLSVVIRAL